MQIPKEKAHWLRGVVDVFSRWFVSEFVRVVEAYSGVSSGLVARTLQRLNEFGSIAIGPDLMNLPDHLGPLVKRAVLSERRRVAAQLEAKKTDTVHPDLLTELEEQLRPYDTFLREPLIREAQPERLPRLTEFLSLERVESIRNTTAQAKPVLSFTSCRPPRTCSPTSAGTAAIAKCGTSP